VKLSRNHSSLITQLATLIIEVLHILDNLLCAIDGSLFYLLGAIVKNSQFGTFKQAQRVQQSDAEQAELGLG